MKTVAELRKYLEVSKLSPEQLGKKANISNMTIRRLLKKPAETPIPAKYQLQLQGARFPELANSGDVLTYLEESAGKTKEPGPETVKSELEARLSAERFEPGFIDQLNKLSNYALGDHDAKTKAIALGAILYFLNPFDLVPDFSGPLGYVDDIGIATVALAALAKRNKG